MSARDSQLQNVIAMYEIKNYDANELAKIEGVDIVFLCDDSGSMRSRVQTTGKTRWDELRETCATVIEIATVFDQDGVDVYFLNRPPIKNCLSRDPRLQQCFAHPPSGYTPLSQALHTIMMENAVAGKTKKLLIMIATDGCPTDNEGNVDMNGFRSVVQRSTGCVSRMVCIQFLACSDNDDDVAWLNRMDKEIKNVDVTDDYESEKQEVLRTGRFHQFSKGDYVVKALLGGIDPSYDARDGF